MTARALSRWVLVAAVLLAACQTDVSLPFGKGSPTPTPPISPTPTITPNVDGPLVVTGTDLPAPPCFAVSDATAGDTVTLSTAILNLPIHEHDEVLLLQVQLPYGPAPGNHDASGTTLPPVSPPATFGFHQFALVLSTAHAPTLTLSSAHAASLVTAAGGGAVQICRVPHYSSVQLVDASIVAAPWDGAVGGVIAFETSALTISAGTAIDASAAGFRGGEGSGVVLTMCNVASTTTPAGGGKGEGLDARWFGNIPNGYGYGMATEGLGGGGGNPCGAAGGGGGNGGLGGNGGQDGNGNSVGGDGGIQITADARSLPTFGGGGGGGANQGNTGITGSAGGGLVWIRTRSLSGGGTINVSGGTGALATNADGMGGGGAGGSIVLEISNPASAAAFTGEIRAVGGDGQSNTSGITNARAGGGGGGGRIFVPSVLAPRCSAAMGIKGVGPLADGASSGTDGFFTTY